MQSRKKRNLEIEKQKRTKRRIFSGIMVLVALLVLAGVGWLAWDLNNRRWIMTFGEERVSRDDLRFLTFGDHLTPETRDAAVDKLIEILVLLEEGNKRDIHPTDEEMEELLQMASWYRESVDNFTPGALNFISDERIAELQSAGIIHMRLMEIYGVYEPDPEDYAEEFAEFLEFAPMWFEESQVRYIASLSWEELEEVERLLEDGADFAELMQQFSAKYDPERNTVEMWDEFFGEYELAHHDVDILLEMEVGDISPILFAADGWLYLVQLYSRELDEEEMEAAFWEDVARVGSETAFVEMFQGWIDAARENIVINQRALNRIA